MNIQITEGKVPKCTYDANVSCLLRVKVMIFNSAMVGK